jgi:hypothetical protein
MDPVTLAALLGASTQVVACATFLLVNWLALRARIRLARTAAASSPGTLVAAHDAAGTWTVGKALRSA